MKHILRSKDGVTVLEGVIALGLLALVTAGAFGVLLASSRQSSTPDIREEMSYAVEKASDLLKVYINAQYGESGRNYLPEELSCGPCGEYQNGGGCAATNAVTGVITDTTPLTAGKHSIKCMIPPVCDRSTSDFFYQVGSAGLQDGKLGKKSREGFEREGTNGNKYGTLSFGSSYSVVTPVTSGKQITFTMRCNGYEL